MKGKVYVYAFRTITAGIKEMLTTGLVKDSIIFCYNLITLNAPSCNHFSHHGEYRERERNLSFILTDNVLVFSFRSEKKRTIFSEANLKKKTKGFQFQKESNKVCST